MPIPILDTERLIMRPLRTDDAADIFEYAQDEAVARNGMWEPYPSFAECRTHVEHLVDLCEKDLMWWALEHRETGRVIGRVELSERRKRDARAELSYALSRPYWGQGLMTESVKPAVDFAWRELGLHRLAATVLPANTASVRVLQRVGMEKEGSLRHYRRLWGEWMDVDVYAVLAPE